jgi:hypothetical protein
MPLLREQTQRRTYEALLWCATLSRNSGEKIFARRKIDYEGLATLHAVQQHPLQHLSTYILSTKTNRTITFITEPSSQLFSRKVKITVAISLTVSTVYHELPSSRNRIACVPVILPDAPGSPVTGVVILSSGTSTRSVFSYERAWLGPRTRYLVTSRTPFERGGDYYEVVTRRSLYTSNLRASHTQFDPIHTQDTENSEEELGVKSCTRSDWEADLRTQTISKEAIVLLMALKKLGKSGV